MTLADPRVSIRDVLRRCFREPDLLTVDQWCDRYRHVPDYSPRRGPWKTVLVQYLRQMMRDFTDPEVFKIVFMAGTQIGKTELFLCALFYAIDRDPGPALYLMDSQDQSQVLMKDRIRPSLEASAALRKYIPTDRSDKQITRVRFDTMALYMAGAGSAGQLAAKSIRYLICDEIDKWPQVLGGRGGTEDAAINVAQSRVHAFGDGAKVLVASSPTQEGVGIHREYMTAERAQYHVPCPHCLGYQVLRFKIDGRGGLRWEGGSGSKLADEDHRKLVEQVRRTAWYECEHCGGKITTEHKGRLIALGVWCFPGQEVRVVNAPTLRKFDPLDHGTHYSDVVPPGVEIVGPKPTSSVRGYHVPQLISPFVSFGQIASEFVAERGEITRAFVNQRLGEPWKQSGSRAAEGQLVDIARQTPEGESSYTMRTVPLGVLALLGTMDVQKDRVFYVVRGYGASENSWLIDAGTVEWPQPIDPDTGELLQPPDSDKATVAEKERWARITEDSAAYVVEQIQRSYPRVGVPEGEVALVRPRFWGIDTGFRTAEAYGLCERMGNTMLAMKGQEAMRFPVKMARVGETAPGKDAKTRAQQQVAGMLDLCEFQNLHWKDRLFQRMWLRPPTHGCYRWPLDLDGDYARQMESEQKVTITIGRTTRFRHEWQLRPGRKDNHFWDCEVMQQVLASQVGVEELGKQTTAAPKGAGPRVGGVRTGR